MSKKRFELWEDDEGWHFRFVVNNGEEVFISECYASSQMARKGIRAARKCFDAEVAKLPTVAANRDSFKRRGGV